MAVMSRCVVSRQFVEALKLARQPAYRLALEVGLHPSTLSQIIHGAQRVQRNDARVLAIARLLGLRADQCFENATPVARLPVRRGARTSAG
jgi:hypothetical protein